MGTKVAVGLRLCLITTTQGLPPLQTLLQPWNVQPEAAVAFIVTCVPLVYLALQVPLNPLPFLVQLILPSVLVTFPSPTRLGASV